MPGICRRGSGRACKAWPCPTAGDHMGSPLRHNGWGGSAIRPILRVGRYSGSVAPPATHTGDEREIVEEVEERVGEAGDVGQRSSIEHGLDIAVLSARHQAGLRQKLARPGARVELDWQRD